MTYRQQAAPDKEALEFQGPKEPSFLRPMTLFALNKFEFPTGAKFYFDRGTENPRSGKHDIHFDPYTSQQ